MGKRAQVATDVSCTSRMSSTRQRTLLHDRARTRAVSQYLLDHRENLLEMLPSKLKKDSNQKRKELERLARQHFNKAPPSEQKIYYDRVAPLVEFRSSGGESMEFRAPGEQPLVEFRGASHDKAG